MPVYKRTVTDHDSGETFEVELRTPRFQDTLDFEEAAYELSYDEQGELRLIPRTGRMRMLKLQRLVMGWTRPQALSADTIAQLPTETAQEIETHINAGPEIGSEEESAASPLPGSKLGSEEPHDEPLPGDD